MRRILSSTEVQGAVDGPNKKILLDEKGIKIHFHAKTGSMLKLVGQVLTFTHADFFEAIADGIAAMMEKASKKSEA